MRPTTLESFAGQRHFLGPDQLLTRMLTADRLTSLLFWGPPGTGKTALAGIIARHSDGHFEQANAALVGVKDRILLRLGGGSAAEAIWPSDDQVIRMHGVANTATKGDHAA